MRSSDEGTLAPLARAPPIRHDTGWDPDKAETDFAVDNDVDQEPLNMSELEMREKPSRRPVKVSRDGAAPITATSFAKLQRIQS